MVNPKTHFKSLIKHKQGISFVVKLLYNLFVRTAIFYGKINFPFLLLIVLSMFHRWLKRKGTQKNKLNLIFAALISFSVDTIFKYLP